MALAFTTKRWPIGTRKSDSSDIWVVNSIGDYELKRLANVAAYREFALHWTLAMIFRQANFLQDDETQLRITAEEDKIAADAFGEIVPLVDWDQDLDADVELLPYRVARG
mgnify:FL=1